MKDNASSRPSGSAKAAAKAWKPRQQSATTSKASREGATGSFNPDPDVLRNDARNLLYSLQKNQEAVRESLNNFKARQDDNTLYSDLDYKSQRSRNLFASGSAYLDQYRPNATRFLSESVNLPRDYKQQQQFLDRLYETAERCDEFDCEPVSRATFKMAHNELMSSQQSFGKSKFQDGYQAPPPSDTGNGASGSRKGSAGSASIKTVSFSNYLRTSGISPRRRARSMSPSSSNTKNMLKKSPSKSILKKKHSHNDLSHHQQRGGKAAGRYEFMTSNQHDEDDSSSLSGQDDFLANEDEDYYHYFGVDAPDAEFDSKLKEIIRMRNLSGASRHASNKASLIESIEKRRRRYLNHAYDVNYEDLEEGHGYSCNSDNDCEVGRRGARSKRPDDEQCCQLRRSLSADDSFREHEKANLESGEPKAWRATSSSSLRKKPPVDAAKKTAKESTGKSGFKSSSSSSVPSQKAKKKSSVEAQPGSNRKYKQMAKDAKKKHVLLGFDWALDALDTKLNTTSSKYEKPDEYWNELTEFRCTNKDDCVSSKPVNFDGSTTFFEFDSRDMSNGNSYNIDLGDTFDRNDDGRNHKCIHSYTLNERLFPVPIYKGKNGQSVCPVCKSTRKEATNYSPQFCKISIPKSRISELQSVIPNNRSVKYSDDTFSLVQNCMAGYEHGPKKSAKMYNAPQSRNVDLKSAAGLSNDLTKLTIDDLKRISTNMNPEINGIYNKAHAMRFDLESQHQKRLRELMPKMQ